MGPHVNFGRGCSSCHTPHSATVRNSVNAPLWGEDVTSTYGAGVRTQARAKTPEDQGVLMCLSCHDGNYAPKAMMKDAIYETLPESYGHVDSVPTFADKPSVTFGPDLANHPIGLGTQVGCGGSLDWDCSMKNGVITMDGSKSAKFAANYGFFNKPHAYEGKEVVVCTTCHNPHSQNATSVTKASSAYTAGDYSTRFFLRAPYDPDGGTSKTSNLSAQYCRQCHADMSNEMNGGSIGTTM
ncbi:MAG TPA: hypothetical protein VE866_04520 [Candidatus Binatia bacterium]|nr:hypothetical protein [Candidatus Binatia bacterium]